MTRFTQNTASEGQRVELRDGKEFVVTVLPEAEPPSKRSPRSHYKLKDVGKGGDVPSPVSSRRR